MTTTLRPLREDEFHAWSERSRAGYAHSIEHDGGVPHDLAVEKAERDYAQILPDGLATPGQAIFSVEVEQGGEVAGSLWVAERTSDAGAILFVYALEIDESYRGQGRAKAAMRAAEAEARRRGLDRIELNVFGGNATARGLYRALGYAEVAVYMGKDLA